MFEHRLFLIITPARRDGSLVIRRPNITVIHISHKFGIDFQSSADDIPIRINNEVLLLSPAIREARRFLRRNYNNHQDKTWKVG